MTEPVLSIQGVRRGDRSDHRDRRDPAHAALC